MRSHRAQEAETYRSNVARESESHRHNVATEDLQNRTLLETITHNRNAEALQHEANQFSYAVGMANAAAHRYSAELSYAGTKYSADKAAASRNYASQLSYAQAVQTSVLGNKTSVRNVQTTTATNLKVAKTNYEATIRSANIQAIGGLMNQAAGAAATIAGKAIIGGK